MEKISVVVPIYNVAPYLQRCVDSILQQTYSHIEVILVDDGSRDASAGICDDYSMKDPRILVIHKENGGLSSARNAGIQRATGTYICFIDADDVIAPFYIEHLHSLCIQYGADIAMGQFQTFTESIQFAEESEPVVTVRTGMETEYLLSGAGYVPYVIACNKLYKTALFAEIRYLEGRINEDEATTYKLYSIADTVVESSSIIYGYYKRQGSITKSEFQRKNLYFLEIARQRYLYFEQLNQQKLSDIFQYLYAMSLISSAYKVRKLLKNKKLSETLKKEFRRNASELENSKNLSNKRRALLFMLRISPGLYPFYSKIQDR